LPPTYGDWLARAERAFGQMLASGRTAFRAELRAADFIPWCRTRRLKVDSSARTQYVSLLVADWCASRSVGNDIRALHDRRPHHRL